MTAICARLICLALRRGQEVRERRRGLRCPLRPRYKKLPHAAMKAAASRAQCKARARQRAQGRHEVPRGRSAQVYRVQHAESQCR